MQDLQERLRKAFAFKADARPGGGVTRPFSPFIDEDMQEATDLARKFTAAANGKKGHAGLAEAVALIEEEAAKSGRQAGLVRYAAKLFVTHHPEARMHLRGGLE